LTKIIFMILLSVIALILIMVGLGFFISALFLFFVSVVHNSMLAALLCGGSFLVAAILLFLIVIIIKSTLFKFKSSKSSKKLKLKEKVEEIKADPAEAAIHVVQEYPFRSALTALASGFIIGFFPKVRDTLIDGVATYINTGSVADSLKSMKSKEE
jgi:hypothetical protein